MSSSSYILKLRRRVIIHFERKCQSWSNSWLFAKLILFGKHLNFHSYLILSSVNVKTPWNLQKGSWHPLGYKINSLMTSHSATTVPRIFRVMEYLGVEGLKAEVLQCSFTNGLCLQVNILAVKARRRPEPHWTGGSGGSAMGMVGKHPRMGWMEGGRSARDRGVSSSPNTDWCLCQCMTKLLAFFSWAVGEDLFKCNWILLKENKTAVAINFLHVNWLLINLPEMSAMSVSCLKIYLDALIDGVITVFIICFSFVSLRWDPNCHPELLNLKSSPLNGN